MSTNPKKKKSTKNTRRSILKELDNKKRRTKRAAPQFKRKDKGKLAR